MATGQTTTSQIPAAVQEFYDRVLLERAIPNIVHDRFGQQRPVRKNSGDQPKFRRINSLNAVVQPLVEGVTPTPQQLSKTEVTGQLVQYGTYVETSDMVDMTNQDPIITEITELLGENAGESLDKVYRDTLVGGTSAFLANDVAARTDIVTAQSEADYKKIVRALQNSKAKPWKDAPIPGSDKVGTHPIASAYYAIVDEYAYFDLLGLTNFIPVAEYPDGGKSAMPEEIGSLGHIRFILTTEAKVYSAGGGAVGSTGYASSDDTSVDVHTALIFGKNAYGICPLEGEAMKMIYHPFGHGDDPLEQRATQAWKATTDIVILNETFMYRYEFAVTA